MKKLLLIPVVAFIAFSCGGENPLETKKKELEALQQQKADIEAQIAAITAEISALDTAGKEGKFALVQTAVLNPDTFLHYIEVQGHVDSDKNVMASPEQPGVVKALYVRVGDIVTQGQMLAQLENSAIKSGLEEAQTGLDLATTTFQKTAALWEQGIGSEINYLQAKAQKESMEKRVASLKAQLAMTQITSPISGYVDEVTFKLGEMASPGMSGVRVVNTDMVKVRAQVADAFVSKLKKGAPVWIDFPDLGMSVQNQIRFVSRTITPGNRSVTVEMDVPNPEGHFRPNMLAAVRINDERVEGAICVPSNVVQRNQKENYIMVVREENGKTLARKVNVTTGNSYGGKTVIASGLSAGDRIITMGYSEVTDGQTVKF